MAAIEPLAAEGEVPPVPAPKGPHVRLGRVQSVDIFEIKESELDVLEKGAPAELYLNFAIFLLSTASTTLATFFTATFNPPKAETWFIVVTVLGFVMGALLLLLWWRDRGASQTVCERIRQRIPPDQQPGAGGVAG